MIRDITHAAPWAGEREAMPGGRGREIALHMERTFKLDEVAGMLGISLRQVRAHVHDGTLAAFNVGRGAERRDLRVLDEDLDAFARRRKLPGITDINRAPRPSANVRKGGI